MLALKLFIIFLSTSVLYTASSQSSSHDIKFAWLKIRILNYTKYEMYNKSLEAFRDLRDDEELGPADWPTVERYITCLNNFDAYKHPHVLTESEDHLKTMSLSDMRVRFLNGTLQWNT